MREPGSAADTSSPLCVLSPGSTRGLGAVGRGRSRELSDSLPLLVFAGPVPNISLQFTTATSGHHVQNTRRLLATIFHITTVETYKFSRG